MSFQHARSAFSGKLKDILFILCKIILVKKLRTPAATTFHKIWLAVCTRSLFSVPPFIRTSIVEVSGIFFLAFRVFSTPCSAALSLVGFSFVDRFHGQFVTLK
jgi:hypothetical protein